MTTFREKYSLEKRSAESSRISAKYPDRSPVIVEYAKGCTLPEIDKRKYLVPTDLSLGQLLFVIRKRIKIPSEEAIFVFINGHLPAGTTLVGSLFKEYVNVDGFLYLTVSNEATFG